jgi:hypothetical protein
MNAKFVYGIAGATIGIFFLIVAGFVAGPAGVLLGLVAFVAVGVRLASHLGWFGLPNMAGKLINGAMMVCIVAITAIWGANKIVQQIATSASAPEKTPITAVAKDYPFCPDADREIFVNNEKKSVTFRNLPSCWGPKINVPPHTDFDIIMDRIDGIQWWNGDVWDRETVLYYLKKKDGWIGKIKYTSFRLRGVGEAKVSI